MDGGAPDPPGFEHIRRGDAVLHPAASSGYTKSTEEKVHLAYSVQAFDPKGVPLTELYKNEMVTEVGPQDKEWMPKIATEIQIPPLVASGAYKIVVKVEDVVAKTSAELTVPFQVRGKTVEPSDTVMVRNFQFYRSEDETEPRRSRSTSAGDGVFGAVRHHRISSTARRIKIDVSYVTIA